MSLLKRTNQDWKLYSFLALMAIGSGVTLFQSFLYGRFDKEYITLIVIGAMLMVIGAFAWAYLSITCPNCNLKLFWYSITKVGLGTWFTWLTNQEECPQCGSRDGSSPPRQKERRSKGKFRNV